MKNNFYFAFVLFSLIFITSCTPVKNTSRISPAEMETVLQEFTEARINQYLYSDKNPKDNLSILSFVLNKHNFSFNEFSENLKKNNPVLFERLFNK